MLVGAAVCLKLLGCLVCAPHEEGFDAGVGLLAAMALSRSSLALLCVCAGVLLLVNVSALDVQEVKAEDAGSTRQQFYLRGNTIGAKPEGIPMTEDTVEGSAEFLANVDVNDYTPGPNCRRKPCRP